jgi:hypothetical protein
LQERGGELNPYHGRTQQFVPFKIPFTVGATIALAVGALIALLIVLATSWD